MFLRGSDEFCEPWALGGVTKPRSSSRLCHRGNPVPLLEPPRPLPTARAAPCPAAKVRASSRPHHLQCQQLDHSASSLALPGPAERQWCLFPVGQDNSKQQNVLCLCGHCHLLLERVALKIAERKEMKKPYNLHHPSHRSLGKGHKKNAAHGKLAQKAMQGVGNETA